MALATEARKPLYAVVGAGDLAVEKTRALPTELVAKATTLVPKTTAFAVEMPTRLRTNLAVELPAKLRGGYADLVGRGEKLVAAIRKQETTEATVRQVKTARRQAKSAVRSVTRAAKSAGDAVEDAAEKIG